MAAEITIDGSGRVVIPKEVRERLHLPAGTRLRLLEDGERLMLVPLHSEAQTAEQGGLLVLRGRLAGAVTDHRQLRKERTVALGCGR